MLIKTRSQSTNKRLCCSLHTDSSFAIYLKKKPTSSLLHVKIGLDCKTEDKQQDYRQLNYMCDLVSVR